MQICGVLLLIQFKESMIFYMSWSVRCWFPRAIPRAMNGRRIGAERPGELSR
jgi:hypothetical protein